MNDYYYGLCIAAGSKGVGGDRAVSVGINFKPPGKNKITATNKWMFFLFYLKNVD
jgi:hypothetical protein